MNAKAAIAALKPLEGHKITILIPTALRTTAYHQPCIRVQHLPPDQRQDPTQGNIILWNGAFSPEGLQAGTTFWAKDIRSITWVYDLIAHIHTHQDKITIIKHWKLDKQGEDQ